MKRLVATVLCLIVILSIIPAAMADPTDQTDEKQRVIVGFKNQANPQIIQVLGGKVDHLFNDIAAIATQLPQQAIDNLQRNPNIAYIEPDFQVQATAETLPWGVDRIDSGIDNLAPVHAYDTGANVKIAVIDTGIYFSHPDLAANYAGGYNFVSEGAPPLDDNGHGTHVAGTIAAIMGNNEGVIGVAPNAQLFALKVLDSSGSGYTSDVIAAIYWARDHGIQVASMSLGSNFGDTALEAACNSAYNSGVLLVAAAGNDYRKIGRTELDTVDYPAKYSSVIAVGATGTTDQKASFSSTGSTVELAAPGEDILSTFPPTIPINGNTGYYYAYGSGTSMACPHVSGAAALVWSSNPALTAAQVRQKLIDTAEDLGTKGKDNWYGYGLVDVDQAVPPTTPPTNHAPVANAGPDQTVTADANGYASVTLDGSASYDPDGDPLQYKWTEGEIILGQTETITYAFQAGIHSVTLTVTDDKGLSSTDQVTITVNPYEPPLQTIQIHASAIEMSTVTRAGGKFVYATSTLQIIDKDNNPVSGVTVNGHWTQPTIAANSGITDTNGRVTFVSATIKNPPSSLTFSFQVDSIVKTGCEYDSTYPLPSETINYP